MPHWWQDSHECFICRILVLHIIGCFSYTACTYVVGPLHMFRSAEHFPLLFKWQTPHVLGLHSGITALEEPSRLCSVSVLIVVPHACPVIVLLMLDHNSHFPGCLLRSPVRHLIKDWILFISVTLELAKTRHDIGIHYINYILIIYINYILYIH